MDLLIRFIPLIVGVIAGAFVAKGATHLPILQKFSVATFTLLCAAYLNTYFNVWLSRKEIRKLGITNLQQRLARLEARKLKLSPAIGHTLMVAAAIYAGVGFAAVSNIALVGAVLLYWFADDALIDDFEKNLLRKRIDDGKRPASQEGSNVHPATAALLRTISEKSKEDPLIGVKIGAREVYTRLVTLMKDEKGVHIESLLCALGALAGYSCQASLRAQAFKNGLPETAALVAVETAIGKTYFFGDHLNKPLAESQYSVWGLAAGAAQHNGCNVLPDIKGIFAYVTETIGSESFGHPRFPEGHNASDTPINYLKVFWPALFPVAEMFCQKPENWPLIFGVAIQEAINLGKEVVAPEIALQIVMESAIPMSKVDLAAA